MSFNNGYKPASEKPFPKPLLHDPIYRFPPKTVVDVELKSGEIYRGTVLANPYETQYCRVIQLVKCVILTNPDDKTTYNMAFDDSEIRSISIYQKPTTRITKTEIKLTCMIIDTKPKFDNVVRLCGIDIKEIAIKFLGAGRGRFSKVGWIVTASRGVLMPIDVIALNKDGLDVWAALKDSLFENEAVLKVFHNARSEMDFLFHCCGTTMKNYYDIQAVDYLLDGSEGLNPQEKLVPLNESLSKYLPEIALDEELEILKSISETACENTANLKLHPWMVRPTPNDKFRKYAAITVKHLIPLRDALEKRRNKKLQEFHQEYFRNIIDAEESHQVLEKEDVFPPELNDIVDYVFLRNKCQDFPPNGDKNRGKKSLRTDKLELETR